MTRPTSNAKKLINLLQPKMGRYTSFVQCPKIESPDASYAWSFTSPIPSDTHHYIHPPTSTALERIYKHELRIMNIILYVFVDDGSATTGKRRGVGAYIRNTTPHMSFTYVVRHVVIPG
jgi:hypothetical protein